MTTLRSRVLELEHGEGGADDRIRAGEVLVDGSVVTNPASMVRAASSVAVRADRPLRGQAKLNAALARWDDIPIAGVVALDAGAAAGGFTQALLEAGARRVYAVDAGYGQLRGSLRQDARVVNLERVNLGDLDTRLVPDPLDAITLDLGYLALADGVPQLNTLDIPPSAELIALVKPMFELSMGSAPTDRATLDLARAHAARGVEAAGWSVLDWMDSPVPGAKGASEMFLRARRRRSARA
jgi:23S rRNA (cytidine1920-2'-O)/16S rRNA (cytidine1409-2'-O)-methyltransferase